MTLEDTLPLKYTYDPETGVLSSIYTGKPVGTPDDRGYLRLTVREGGSVRNLKVHRIAYFLMTGEWPEIIDHINRIRTDNRFCNLRPASTALNSRNRTVSKNKDLPLGVKRSGSKFQAVTKIAGKAVNLGTYTDVEEASAAYWEAQKILALTEN